MNATMPPDTPCPFTVRVDGETYGCTGEWRHEDIVNPPAIRYHHAVSDDGTCIQWLAD